MPDVDFNSDSHECMISHLHYQCKHVDGIDFTLSVPHLWRPEKNPTNSNDKTRGKIMKRLSFPLTKCESGLQESHRAGLQQTQRNSSELGKPCFEQLPDSTSNIPFAVFR